MGHVELPVVLTLIGLFVKAVLDYTLAAVPRVNVLGGAVGTLVCYALASVLACIAIRRIAGVKIDFFPLLKAVSGIRLLWRGGSFNTQSMVCGAAGIAFFRAACGVFGGAYLCCFPADCTRDL